MNGAAACFAACRRDLLKIRLLNLEIPPDLPGVGKHLPDVFELDPSERLAPCKVKLDRHLDKLCLLPGGKREKLDVKSIAVDLA